MVSGVEGQTVSVSVQEERLRKLRESVERKHNPRIAQIANAVAAHYGISFEDLVARRQHQYIAWPRMVTYYLACKYKAGSANKIARILGMRSNSAVLNGMKRVRARLEREPVIRDQIQQLEKQLRELS